MKNEKWKYAKGKMSEKVREDNKMVKKIGNTLSPCHRITRSPCHPVDTLSTCPRQHTHTTHTQEPGQKATWELEGHVKHVKLANPQYPPNTCEVLTYLEYTADEDQETLVESFGKTKSDQQHSDEGKSGRR